MKKIFLLFLIILISISGCSQKNNINNNTKASIQPKPDSRTEKPQRVIPADFLNILYPAYKDAKYDNIMGWQEYIENKLGIKINVYYKAFYPDTVLDLNTDGIVYLNYQKGVPFQFNTTVFEYYNDEISYELSKYYEKYHWNQYIDPDYLSALTIDGNLYAVPTAINKYIKPRYYNEVTLNTLNLSVPNTINEFYDYLIKAKNLYSDDDTYYPMVIMNHRFASSVSDIARAFGVYFNDYFNSSVSFNPQTDSIEDAIFSEQITELISFIRQLQINGLLRTYGRYNRINPFSDELLDTYITNLDRVNKNFASEYNFVYSKSINGFIDYLFADKSYESINGYYLTGNNDKNVCEIHSDMGFYVFPRNIDNIDGVIDTFNSLFSNPDNYMDFKYGIIGEDYRIVNDNIVTINSSHSRSADLELKLISDPYKHDSSYVPESIQIIEKIDSYSAYERNVFNHMNTYSSVPLYNIFSFNKNEGLEAIFNPDIPIQDAIEYYKRLVIKSGRINTINELNKQLGKETQYDYNVN